jgi:hypothetical protein
MQSPNTPPSLLQIYRDFIKPGSEAAYREVEADAARMCAEHHCPHPHFGMESLTTPTETWWLNAYDSEAGKDAVAEAYMSNRPLMAALDQIPPRKQELIGPHEDIFVNYRPDLSRGSSWKIAGARFFVVTVTRADPRVDGSVFEAADGRRFILRPTETRAHADIRGAAILGISCAGMGRGGP